MLNIATIRTLLFDMDGVLYRGKERLPGVQAILDFCQQRDIAYACITNNSTRTPLQYEQKLAAMDIHVPAALIITSSLVTGRYLRNHYPQGTSVFAIGMQGLHDALFADGYFIPEEKHPDLVVQGADFEITYEKLKLGCLAIRAGARFIATNPDKTFPTEYGLTPGAGSLMAALQAATDVEPLVIGKPQPTMFEVALEMLDATPDTAVAIGDRLDTDIAGAQNANLRSVLVLSGVTERSALPETPYSPDLVVEDLPELLAMWQDG